MLSKDMRSMAGLSVVPGNSLCFIDRVGGQRYFCSNRISRKETVGAVRLSPREQQVLALIASGITTKEIAGKLFISVPTVETHRANLMTKTGARNVSALVRVAVESERHVSR